MVGGVGPQNEVAARIEQLKHEFERAENEHDKDALQARIARLSGSVAVIHVGAATGVELTEKQHRVEDSLSATRAALEEGIVAGGGTALVQAAQRDRRARPARREGPRRAHRRGTRWSNRCAGSPSTPDTPATR